MALNIKDRETEKLAAEVAAMAGESKTRAVKVALQSASNVSPCATCAATGSRSCGGSSSRKSGRRFLQEAGLTVIPFSEEHWRIAVEAYWRFGKGRHPAGLNRGDCLTYAVARLSAQPLLFVGDDFSRTDLARA
jgi:uncharacterized protein with PIN domain